MGGGGIKCVSTSILIPGPCWSSESSSSTPNTALLRFLRADVGALNNEEGDDKGSVSRFGSVSIGGTSHVDAVDIGGSEGGSCEDNK